MKVLVQGNFVINQNSGYIFIAVELYFIGIHLWNCCVLLDSVGKMHDCYHARNFLEAVGDLHCKF